jgi:hypothetical protein
MLHVEAHVKLKASRLLVLIVLVAMVLLTTSCGGHFARTPAPQSVERDAASMYGAFLNSWSKGGKYTVNVYKAAQLRTQQDPKDYTECARKLGERNPKWGESYSFRDLRRVIGKLPYVHFVRSNDSRALVRDRPTAEATTRSAIIAAGFAHSVVTLSAITFNKPHTLAMFQFASVCGGLCGYGHVVVFKRTPNGWVLQKKSTSCGAWMS